MRKNLHIDQKARSRWDKKTRLRGGTKKKISQRIERYERNTTIGARCGL
jgi:hypothetical protein